MPLKDPGLSKKGTDRKDHKIQFRQQEARKKCRKFFCNQYKFRKVFAVTLVVLVNKF